MANKNMREIFYRESYFRMNFIRIDISGFHTEMSRNDLGKPSLPKVVKIKN